MMTERSNTLLIATRNLGKVRELEEILRGLGVRLLTLADFPDTMEAEETGATFAENAALKAISYAQQTGLPALADDSGLEVAALGGAPGLHSARYAGVDASDADRMARLLAELERTGNGDRRARFVCAVAVACGGGEEAQPRIFKGSCAGRIAHEARGAGGFGYDPIFIPEGYTQTFAELPSEIKQLISHRARALAAARSFLRDYFQGAA